MRRQGNTDLEAPDTSTSADIRLWLVILVFMLIGLALRLFDLGGKSFWGDEAYSWFFAMDDLGTMWHHGGPDPHHPPLYHMILSWVLPISQSEFALRLPSAVASTLTIGVVALIGAQVASTRAAIIAAALATVSPLEIWYAQDARQAAMATLFCAAATYGLVRRDLAGTLLGVFSLLAALLTYYLALAFWAGVLGLCLGAGRNHRSALARQWLWITAPALLVFLPLQGSHMVDGMSDYVEATGGTGPARLLAVPLLTDNLVGILAVACIGGAVGAVIIRVLNRHQPRLLLAIGVAGFVGLALAASWDRGLSMKRVIVLGIPIALVVLAALISGLQTRRSRMVLTGTLITISLISSAAVLSTPKDDWRSAVALINSESSSDDVIWVLGPDEPWASSPFQYYGAVPGLVPAQILEELPERAADEIGRIWIVASRTPRDSIPSSATEAWLDGNWQLDESVPLNRLEVRRYAR